MDRLKDGEESMTVPMLEGMLGMLETYFPEEIISSPQMMEAEAKMAGAANKATHP